MKKYSRDVGTLGHGIICDYFRAATLENRTILVVADGCGWGRKARAAAETVSKVQTKKFRVLISQAVMEYMLDIHIQKNIRNTGDCNHELLSAFRHGHDAIIKSCDYIDECGTSTLLSGMIMRLRPHSFLEEEWAFVAVSVGDCKAYHWDPVKKKITDITFGNRTDVRDARDCGGRLGPYIGVSDPDLRNLASFHHPCKPGDIIFVCTDGVHDNLDPEALGLKPNELVSSFSPELYVFSFFGICI